MNRSPMALKITYPGHSPGSRSRAGLGLPFSAVWASLARCCQYAASLTGRGNGFRVLRELLPLWIRRFGGRSTIPLRIERPVFGRSIREGRGRVFHLGRRCRRRRLGGNLTQLLRCRLLRPIAPTDSPCGGDLWRCLLGMNRYGLPADHTRQFAGRRIVDAVCQRTAV
jgi:hypothetical protein